MYNRAGWLVLGITKIDSTHQFYQYCYYYLTPCGLLGQCFVSLDGYKTSGYHAMDLMIEGLE